MKAGFISRLKGFHKNWVFWLFLVTGIAILIRSIPAWTNYGWGCDLGIYLGIAKNFVATGELYSPYTGWGSSYNYFPVLYAVTGFVSWVTGLDVSVVMPKIGPVFGGLTVLLFFFVVRELTGNKKIALLASLILAVLPFHVYQTSHTYPLTMGHFFMMFSLYFFLRFRRNTWYAIPLLISTALLIMSHHLTTYFYLISLIAIVFVENASRRNWTKHLKMDVAYVLTASIMIFSYWAFIAIPVYESFMRNGINIGPFGLGNNTTIFLFYFAFAGSFLLIWLKRRFNLFIEKKEPSAGSSFKRFCLIFLFGFCLIVTFVFVKIPGVNFVLPIEIIFLTIPLLLAYSFALAGFRSTYFIKNGAFIRGWLLAILASLVFTLVANIGPLFPHRHFEYLDVPISILAAYGIRSIFLKTDYNRVYSKIKSFLNLKFININKIEAKNIASNRNIIYVMAIVFLVTANAFSVYSLHDTLGQSHEGISAGDTSTIEIWMSENLDKNKTIIASDHRLERIAESAGFNTTKDETYDIWYAENIEDCIHELYGIGKNYSRISHIIVDDIMIEKQVHIGLKRGGVVSIIMSDKSYEKFKSPFFELICRNETEEIDDETGEPVHWTEVYEVKWDYINSYIGSKN